MGDAVSEETKEMKCSFKHCTGEYEDTFIIHTVKQGDNIIVFQNVPAEVCTICGDSLLNPDTVRSLEKALNDKAEPERMIPLYQYA